MKISVILPAAGLGRRFAVGGVASASKIEFELLHKPVFLRAIALFRDRHFRAGEIEQIILPVSPDNLDAFRFRWEDQLDFQNVTLMPGGVSDRWETVQLALERVNDSATHVAVHDAARPCASAEMIERVFAAAAQYGAAVPGLAMSDTTKRVEPHRAASREAADPLADLFGNESQPATEIKRISQTVPRHDLYRVQTPQVFEKGLLVAAYGRLNPGNASDITDDASAVEQAGHDVFVVQGDPLNLKLTHPEDVELLEAVLRLRQENRAKNAATKQLFDDEDD